MRMLAMVAALLGAGVAPAAERQMLPDAVVPTHYDVHVMPDAKALTFAGEASIDVEVRRTTDRLVLNAADLTVDRATVDGGAPVASEVDATAQTVAIRLAAPLAPGRHRLAIAWHGAISRFTSGFFAVDYDGDGGPRRIIATKFEPAAARRFMPLWDEPARKASYTLTADVPAADLALSNMPVAKTAARPGGLKRVTFQPTPAMSSYLLFFGSGDLERVSRRVGKVDVGVVVRRGAAARARFALDAAAEVLAWYDDYFGTPYPLPKLDLIAAPGVGSFGAMENWGAIFFFESRLLVDPRTATANERRAVHAVVAHEIAHQWFGDLVTMAWWDDLWLNEGFASWMAAREMAALHPDWRVDLTAQAEREAALLLDALPGTHPVIQPVASGPAANQAFDRITYGKGQAVIAMLEAHVGADAFRAGVRAYIRDHAYANTTNADLWAAVERASGQPAGAIAGDFLTRPGIPLIRVADDGTMRQGRFSFDPAATGGGWRLPVTVQPVGGAARHMLLTDAGGRVAPPFVANAGQASYARVAYGDGAFAALLAALPTLPAADQLGLLLDGWALGQTDVAPPARPLALIARLPATADPLVWRSALAILAEIDGLHGPGPTRDAFRAWARARAGRAFARVGWDARTAEGANDAVLREAALRLLGGMGDAGVIAEARRRHAAGATGPLATPILAIVAASADRATFDELRARARDERDPQEKARLYGALASVRDPALAADALAIATGGEAPATLASTMVATVSTAHPDLAWDHALATLPGVSGSLDLRQRYQYLPRVVQSSLSPARADALHALAARDFPADARRFADQAETAIRQRAGVAATRLPQIDAWIAAHPG